MSKSATKTKPPLAHYADEFGVFLKHRALAIEAQDWPAEAANDNTPPPAAAPEDLAGARAEARLDARPSLAYLEALGPGADQDGPWNLDRLKFHGESSHAKGEPRTNELVAFLDGCGKWRKPSDGFGAPKSAKAAGDVTWRDREGVRDAATDVVLKVEAQPISDTDRPSVFEWSPRFTTAAQRADWRALLTRLGCDGSQTLDQALSANGLKTGTCAPQHPPKLSLVYPTRLRHRDDESGELGSTQRGQTTVHAPSVSEARAELKRIYEMVGPQNVEVARAFASARTVSDIGYLSHPDACRQWAAVIGIRRARVAAAAFTEAFKKIENEENRSAA